MHIRAMGVLLRYQIYYLLCFEQHCMGLLTYSCFIDVDA